MFVDWMYNADCSLACAVALGFTVLWLYSRKRISGIAAKALNNVQRQNVIKEETDYFKLTGVPPPTPLPDFDVKEALPRPYRPFRWKYYQTMSLQAMEPDWWLELESTYFERISQRKELYAKHGTTIVHALPGSEPACVETMEMAIEFLRIRYPNQFQYSPETGIFHNKLLDTRVDTRNTDPLVFLLENVPEDFLIVQENEKTGLYHFRAGVSTSAVGWNMHMKMGRPLHEVHGPVPFYKEKMQHSMDRFFSKMTCDKPIQRGSWSIEIGQPLFIQTDDPHWHAKDVQKADLNIDELYLRVDWQTLRRLPKSRAIVFNFKALFTPVTQFREEPFVPRLIATVLRESEGPLLKYKGTYHIEHKLLPALDEWSKEQEDRGWVPKDWEVRTLDENPFYPGWELHHKY